jgi:hypothetical protein
MNGGRTHRPRLSVWQKSLGKTGFVTFNAWVMNRLADFFIFLALYNLVTIFHLLGFLLSGLLMGFKPEKITLFWFSRCTIQTPLCPLEIGFIPMGGSVKFTDEFEQSSLPVRWLVVLSGPLLGVLSALVGLPFERILPSLLSGFGQVLHSVYSPIDYGAPLLQKFFDESVRTSLFAAYAILAVKVEAFNLLPLTVLNGGQLLTAFFPNFNESRWGEKINQLSMVTLIVMHICLTVAFFVYLF